MDEFLLIDGYNIINSWEGLKETGRVNLEDSRDKLIDIIKDYQGFTGYNVIIVFDGYLVKNSIEKHYLHGKVEVVYTKEGETADNYIERFVHSFQGNAHIRVATSDFVEQTIVLGRGATRISARELLNEVKSSKKSMNMRYIKKPQKSKNLLENSLDPDILSKLESMRRQK